MTRSPLRRWNLSRESFRNAGRISGDDCRLPSTRRCRWEERKYLKKCCIFAKNTRGQFNKTPAMAPQVPAFEVKLATDSAFKLTWTISKTPKILQNHPPDGLFPPSQK
ncbi:uncharacterized protein LOC135112214 isoform X3 [Scylla paramamosain]|uniref:uncharacterized protein LOC135112214 isoform X3 n=1 Tax=Scylla paramamosain TaxID=85552 RepID=UPI003082A88D